LRSLRNCKIRIIYTFCIYVVKLKVSKLFIRVKVVEPSQLLIYDVYALVLKEMKKAAAEIRGDDGSDLRFGVNGMSYVGPLCNIYAWVSGPVRCELWGLKGKRGLSAAKSSLEPFGQRLLKVPFEKIKVETC